MRPRLGVAVVGTGSAGRQHVQALRDVGGAHLAAVCDVDPLRAARLAADAEVAARTWEEVLDDPAVGIVALCTPPGAHLGLARAAIDAGKAVLLEKPPVLDEADLDVLLEASHRAGRPVAVMLQHRFRLTDDVLDVAWPDGGLGVLEVVRYRPAAHYEREAWRNRPEVAGGGFFAHLGVHYADLLCQIFGPPREVTGNVRCAVVPGVDTSFELLVAFEHGHTATIAGTASVDARGERLAVYGDKRRLTVVDGRLTYQAGDETRTVEARPTIALRSDVYEEFCAALRSGTVPPRSQLARSRGVVRLLENVRRLSA